MPLIVFLSGLINLSAQALYQKVVSMTAGDLYTTFIIVTLTFISGSALGSYFGRYLRRYLPWIEVASGLYSFLLLALLSEPFYKYDIPSFLVVLGLLPPALALGTHLPLYSYYLRQKRFSLIYSFYHLGALLGLFAFEWYFVQAGSVKMALAFLGSVQLLLGLFILWLYKKNQFHIHTAPDQKINFPRSSSIAVFLISVLSFYQVFWALKTQTLMTEALRLQLTTITIAIFSWMTLAGLFSKFLTPKVRSIYFLLWALCLLLLQTSFSLAPSAITGLYSGTLLNYFAVSYLLALYLTVPILFSSLLFIGETQKLSTPETIDRTSGYLNLFACAGNIMGFILGGVMAPTLWSSTYFGAAILIAAISYFVFSWKDLQSKRSLSFSLSILLLGLSFFALANKQTESLMTARLPKKSRGSQSLTLDTLHVNAYSTIVLAIRDFLPAFKNDPALPPASLYYIVDGHLSHSLNSGGELMTGLMGAKYFKQSPAKSLVIGVGTGQSAWAVSAFSQQTDIIEISPMAIEGLDFLKQYNGDLKNQENLHINIADGFSQVRNCTANSYDFILNTATYPGNFNASKLYSEEFVELAKKCLSPHGVYQTYFDNLTVHSMEQFEEFLAPIHQHFKHVDIILKPYPLVFAYDEPRDLQPLTVNVMLRPKDRIFFEQELRNGLISTSSCFDILRDVPAPTTSVATNSLDRAYLERNSIQGLVELSQHHLRFIDLKDFYQSADPHPFTCQ